MSRTGIGNPLCLSNKDLRSWSSLVAGNSKNLHCGSRMCARLTLAVNCQKIKHDTSSASPRMEHIHQWESYNQYEVSVSLESLRSKLIVITITYLWGGLNIFQAPGIPTMLCYVISSAAPFHRLRTGIFQDHRQPKTTRNYRKKKLYLPWTFHQVSVPFDVRMEPLNCHQTMVQSQDFLIDNPGNQQLVKHDPTISFLFNCFWRRKSRN